MTTSDKTQWVSERVVVTTSDKARWVSEPGGGGTVTISEVGEKDYVKVCPLDFIPTGKKGVPIEAKAVKYLKVLNTPYSFHIDDAGNITHLTNCEDETALFVERFKALDTEACNYISAQLEACKCKLRDRRNYVHWMCVKSPDEPLGVNPVAIVGWPMLDSIDPDLILEHNRFNRAVELASLLLQSKAGNAKDEKELLLSVTLRLFAGGYKSEPIDDRSFFYSMFSIPDYQCDCDDMSMIVAAVATALQKADPDEYELSDDAKELIAYLKQSIKGIYVAHGQANTPQGEHMIGHVWVIMTTQERNNDTTPNFKDCLLVECTTSSAPNQSSTEVATQLGLQKRRTADIPILVENSEVNIRMLPPGRDYITIALYGVNEAYAVAKEDNGTCKLGVAYADLSTGENIKCITLHNFTPSNSKDKEKIKIDKLLTTKYSDALFSDSTLEECIESTREVIPKDSKVEKVVPGMLVPGHFISSNSSGTVSKKEIYELLPTVSWAYTPIRLVGDDTAP